MTEHLPSSSEQWRPVVGYEGLYEVSSKGRVKAVARRLWVSPGGQMTGRWRQKREVIARGMIDRHGYHSVCLRRDGKSRWRRVHMLVLDAFVGPCPPGMQTRHLNGARSDNRVENLAWGTVQENADDRQRHGTVPKGELHHRAKLTVDQVRSIRAAPQREIPEMCRVLCISPATACYIRKRKLWASLE